MIVRVQWATKDGGTYTVTYSAVVSVDNTGDRLVIEQPLVTTYLFTQHMRGWSKED